MYTKLKIRKEFVLVEILLDQLSVIISKVTKVFLRQAYVCQNKRHVLLRQKLYLWQLPPMIGMMVASLTFEVHVVG